MCVYMCARAIICASLDFASCLPACLPACISNLWSRRMNLIKEKPLSPKRVVPDKITNARYSFDLLFCDRRRWRRAYIEGQVIGRNVPLYRHLLRVGLLLALARVSKVRVLVGLWSVRRALHHTLHRRQHALHGVGSSRHGQRYGASAQIRQLRECCDIVAKERDIGAHLHGATGELNDSRSHE